MNKEIESFKMGIEFKGLIHLLAKNLYSEPDVFIRELIQNANDGIVKRKRYESYLSGYINIDYDKENSTITVSDNGIGMDRKDIKEFLSVIGSTGTGTTREKMKEEGLLYAYELIGQFGIGMLAAFIVAEKVIVRTRKSESTSAYEWHNCGSADCEMFEIEKDTIGTDIVIVVQDVYKYFLDDEKIKQVIIKYCDFIPFPITIRGIGPVNQMDAPWHKRHYSSDSEIEYAYGTYINHRYPDYFLDIIPVNIEEPYKAYGVLYISDRSIPDVNTSGKVDIFIRRMLVKSDDTNILPTWAKFIRGVIDSPDLQPTAARDNIQTKTPAYEFLQKKLGEIVVDRLRYLAQNEPAKFRQINQWHHYHIKGMALYFDDFFVQIAEMLLFDTNKGLLSLKEYLTKNPSKKTAGNKVPIYYFSHYNSEAQFYRMADSRDLVVINAGARFDEELLNEYAKKNPNTIHIERLDTSDDEELFQKLDTNESESFRQFELNVETELRRLQLDNINVRMRKFAPEDVPAVLITSQETEAENRLKQLIFNPAVLSTGRFTDMFEKVRDDFLTISKKKPIYLNLNANNILIKKLSSVELRDETIKQIVVGIYNSAILYSHSNALFTAENLNAIHTHTINTFTKLLEFRERTNSIQIQLEQERAKNIKLSREIQEQEKPEHILIFMITPFDSSYNNVEQAVRNVFERSPFYFEVKLARDYTHTNSLAENVREHMSRAHGFIAEISDLNPNVMLEIGAIMLSSKEERPIFTIRCSDGSKNIPTDIKDMLYISYKSKGDTVEEIEKSLKEAFIKDGRIIHGGLSELVKRRKKRFLSITLLKSLTRIRMSDDEISKVLQAYNTVDDLVDTSEAEFEKTGVKGYMLPSITGELKERIEHESRD